MAICTSRLKTISSSITRNWVHRDSWIKHPTRLNLILFIKKRVAIWMV